jgi:hypothetical protein
MGTAKPAKLTPAFKFRETSPSCSPQGLQTKNFKFQIFKNLPVVPYNQPFMWLEIFVEPYH